MNKPSVLAFSALVLSLILSACNLPAPASPTSAPNAIFTAAAQTVEAQLTQSAVLLPTSAPPVAPTPAAASPLPPTDSPQATLPPAPQPTTAAQPTTACDSAQFLADVTVPDGQTFKPGEAFTKTWQLKNIGTCTWDSSYVLIFDDGAAMSGAAALPLTATVAPGQSINLSVNLVAPSAEGTYRGYWRIRSGAGVLLPVTSGYQGKSFYVEIKVDDAAAVPSDAKFAVTSVGFTVSRDGTCAAGKYIVTASLTVNKPGQVTYTWVRSDGVTGAALSGSLNFTEAGTKNITFEWSTSVSGLWMDLYVDNPNHQQFGRASLNCP